MFRRGLFSKLDKLVEHTCSLLKGVMYTVGSLHFLRPLTPNTHSLTPKLTTLTGTL